MKIEVRKLKIYRSFSEETTAYTADIFVDGIRTFAARNDGHGGCDFYQPYPTAKVTVEQVDAWLKANNPATEFGPYDLEWFMIGQLDAAESASERKRIEKKFAGILAKSVAALRDGALVTFKAAPTPANLAAVRARHPALVVLNDADDETRARGLLAYCPDLAAA